MKQKNLQSIRWPFYSILFLCACFYRPAIGGNWKGEPLSIKGFVENKGQFEPVLINGEKTEVLYAFDGPSEDYFFTAKGIVLSFTEKQNHKKNDQEKIERQRRKLKGFKSADEWEAFEKEERKVLRKNERLECVFTGALAGSEIFPEFKNPYYHSYAINKKNNQIENINYINSFRKLIYKNIYPNTDLVYEFHHNGGLKYSFVLHPGAAISDIQLFYSKDIFLQPNGNIHTPTKFGNIIDHKPITFYADKQTQIIESSYLINKRNIGFKLGSHDASKTIIIDPWVQTPAFNSNWDCVWECERDALGNVYIIGGVDPLQLLKYNAAGALQWTYNTPYDTTAWMGTFATDLNGNSYITNGSAAAIQKVNTAGSVVWNNPNPGGLFSSTELWTIAFNCDQTKLIVGGTGGFLPPIPYIYDIDMNSGNVTASVQTNQSGGLFDIEEVRSITACSNAKYYFLTHDSIGFIHQSLSSCLNGTFPFHASSGYGLGYKCENWRYDNSGIAAIRYYNGFIYTHRGNQLDKRDFNTAAIIASVAIPGGAFNNVFLGGNQYGNSGIDIDNCGNVFVGSSNGVYKFDQNLAPLGNFPTTFKVYDVVVSINGDVIACGSTGDANSNSRTGAVQSFAASACIPQATICCDATICNVPSLCTTDAPFQLQPTTTGGTWTGTGVNASGLFDPATAGVGTFTVTYALACGSESINITVNNCTALSVCEETNGTYTVSGGTGPYTWSYFQPATSTPITTQAECTACGFTWFFGQCLNGFFPATTCNTAAQWVVYGNNSNAPAPPGFPAQVEDNAGTIFTINAAGIVPPCAPCPVITINSNNITNAACSGGTGSATPTATGGTGPYTYNWQPGNLNGATQNNLNPGTYNVLITDGNGCTGSTTVTITAPAALTASSFGAIASTCGAANGTAYANASGGTSPYTYTWSNSAGNLQITNNSLIADTLPNLASGDYFILIQDANNCTFADTISIATSPSPSAALNGGSSATCGASNGSIVVAASGGTGTYTFQWSNNTGVLQTNNNVVSLDSLTGIPAGSYTIVITDQSGCSDTLISAVNNANAAVLNLVSQTNILCFGDNNGNAIVSTTGGTGPYTFEWVLNNSVVQTGTGVSVSDTLNNALPGQYQVAVTDNVGCLTNLTINITGPTAPLTINALSTNSASCGLNNGSAAIVVSGGTAGTGYQYNWQPSGGNGANANNLGVGAYTVTVTDANLCSTDTSFAISNPNGPSVTIVSTTNPTCFGLANGVATVNASGGTGNITYQWSSGLGNSTTVNNLAPGSYSVTATDSLGCSGSVSVSITQPPLIVANISTSNAYCATSSGSAQVSASGGTGNLTYLWNNGSTGNSTTGLPPGNCNVTITDSLGCVQIFSAVIGSSGNFTVSAGANETIQLGNSVELIATGPAGATYSWSPSSSLSCATCDTTLATPQVSTVYVVTVTNNGCLATDTVVITVEQICGDVFIPSGFSPNGDLVNDILYARGICIVELDFKVYDRWGELIFSTSDQNIGWDGTFKGKPALSGVYVYTVSAKVKGSIINAQGNVTLLRE
jgi:gliding motility-associated-like protein